MNNRIAEVYFYKPKLEDLWFREAMMADPDTMSYNSAWGGTIPFPLDIPVRRSRKSGAN